MAAVPIGRTGRLDFLWIFCLQSAKTVDMDGAHNKFRIKKIFEFSLRTAKTVCNLDERKKTAINRLLWIRYGHCQRIRNLTNAQQFDNSYKLNTHWTKTLYLTWWIVSSLGFVCSAIVTRARKTLCVCVCTLVSNISLFFVHSRRATPQTYVNNIAGNGSVSSWQSFFNRNCEIGSVGLASVI